MDTVRLGIIGLGYIGKVHLRHSLKLKNARTIAVADLSEKALKKSKNLGIKTFNDYKQLLADPNIDAVIISLPTHLHTTCATEAAEAKKHIFLEKPIARNVEEAKKILSVAEHNSVKLMIGYPMRFNPKFCNFKEEIDNGSLGDVEIANATYISTGPFFHRADGYSPVPVPEWWFNRELTGGGVLIDLGSHLINLLRWYFGEVTDIKSCLKHRFNLEQEDSATCLAKFESGTQAIINVGWFSQQYHLGINLLGSVKHAILEQKPPNLILTALQMLTTGNSKFYQPHFAELEYFVNCLIHDKSPSPSGEDGLKDIEAISRAYRNEIKLN